MLNQYLQTKPDLCKRFMDDDVELVSFAKQEIEHFLFLRQMFTPNSNIGSPSPQRDFPFCILH